MIGGAITDIAAGNRAATRTILVSSRKCYLCEELERRLSPSTSWWSRWCGQPSWFGRSSMVIAPATAWPVRRKSWPATARSRPVSTCRWPFAKSDLAELF